MTTIKCPKCGNTTPINISLSVSEDGEVFRCSHCNWLFRYVSK